MTPIFLAYLIAVLMIYAIIAYIIAKIIKNNSSDRKPFWWLFFFTPFFGIIIYTQLVNNDLLEEAVKRLEE